MAEYGPRHQAHLRTLIDSGSVIKFAGRRPPIPGTPKTERKRCKRDLMMTAHCPNARAYLFPSSGKLLRFVSFNGNNLPAERMLTSLPSLA